MANFKVVNKAIKKAFPNLDIEAVKGDGYVYFDGDDGMDKVESVMIHPPSVDSDTLADICINTIADVYS